MKIVGRPWGVSATAAFAAAGLGALSATCQVETARISTTCKGDDAVRKTVLVACATRPDSTAEVRPGTDVAPLGSAVRFARSLPERVGCPGSNRQSIAEIPVAVCIMHILAHAPAAVAERRKHSAKAGGIIAPRDEAFFEGRIDLSLPERLAVRLVKSPVGDRRDWPRIEGWADGLVPRLTA